MPRRQSPADGTNAYVVNPSRSSRAETSVSPKVAAQLSMVLEVEAHPTGVTGLDGERDMDGIQDPPERLCHGDLEAVGP